MDFWIFYGISGFFGGFLDFLEDFWIFWGISGFFGGFLDFVKDFWIFYGISEGIFWIFWMKIRKNGSR